MKTWMTKTLYMLRLHDRGFPHAGIAYCAQRSRTVKQMLRQLMAIYRDLTPEDMMNHVEYL